MLENIISTEMDARFFYRNGFEVDFIIQDDGELIAIEVKMTEKDVKQVKKFVEKFGNKVKKVIIIDMEKEGKTDSVEIIPAWKFLLTKLKKHKN